MESLSSTEQKILLMVSNDMTFKEIAEVQLRSESAIKSIMHKIYNKIGAKDKADASRIATECGIQQFVKW